MTRTARHRFRTREQAAAFEEGVRWVNDSSLIVWGVENAGKWFDIVIEDDDRLDDGSYTTTYTYNGDGTYSTETEEP